MTVLGQSFDIQIRKILMSERRADLILSKSKDALHRVRVTSNRPREFPISQHLLRAFFFQPPFNSMEGGLFGAKKV